MKIVTHRTRIRAGITKVVHINGAVLRANKRQSSNNPCLTVQCTDGVYYGRRVLFPKGVVLEQHFDQPRSNGAVVWLTTRSEVVVCP
jgi:hypothetical protein